VFLIVFFVQRVKWDSSDYEQEDVLCNQWSCIFTNVAIKHLVKKRKKIKVDEKEVNEGVFFA